MALPRTGHDWRATASQLPNEAHCFVSTRYSQAPLQHVPINSRHSYSIHTLKAVRIIALSHTEPVETAQSIPVPRPALLSIAHMASLQKVKQRITASSHGRSGTGTLRPEPTPHPQKVRQTQQVVRLTLTSLLIDPTHLNLRLLEGSRLSTQAPTAAGHALRVVQSGSPRSCVVTKTAPRIVNGSPPQGTTRLWPTIAATPTPTLNPSSRAAAFQRGTTLCRLTALKCHALMQRENAPSQSQKQCGCHTLRDFDR